MAQNSWEINNFHFHWPSYRYIVRSLLEIQKKYLTITKNKLFSRFEVICTFYDVTQNYRHRTVLVRIFMVCTCTDLSLL